MNETRISRVAIGSGFGVRLGGDATSPLHRQHGVALLIGLDAEVTVAIPGGARIQGRAVMVPHDVPHEVSCDGPALGLLYDPEDWGSIAAFSRSGARALQGSLEAKLAQMAAHAEEDDGVLCGIAEEAAALFGDERAPLDLRVARALELLRDRTLDDHAKREALRAMPISSAHLRALFQRDVGISIRTYRLWHRLIVAVTAMARLDATAAAHYAGFADLAHFSRTCRRMLGYPPSAIFAQRATITTKPSPGSGPALDA